MASWIVFHDYRLEAGNLPRSKRQNGSNEPTPRIKDLSLAELRAYDIGRANPASEYARAHPDLLPSDGERIPTLEEVIAVVKGAFHPFKLFVELEDLVRRPRGNRARSQGAGGS